MTYMSEKDARNLICEFGRRLYEKDMVAANDGNITVKIADDRILATPTGVSKGFMTPEMMSVVSLSGEVLEIGKLTEDSSGVMHLASGGKDDGTIPPSSEVKMHLRIFNENPSVGACVHAHPVNATCFAIAGIPLDAPICTETIPAVGNIPVAEFGIPGSQQVPDSVAPFARDYNACLLAFHGVLTWGDDLLQAYYRMETVEHYAMMTLRLRYQMKSDSFLNPEQVAACLIIREDMGETRGGVPEGRW